MVLQTFRLDNGFETCYCYSLTFRQFRNEACYSCCKNGLAIASMPSTGHTRTTDVPRQTTSPSGRVSSDNLNGSSGSIRKQHHTRCYSH